MRSKANLSVLICICLSPALALGAAELQWQGATLITSGQFAGNYDHVYNLVNTAAAPTIPIYDIDFDYSYAAAWLYMSTPSDNWAIAPWEGPLRHWQTETAPCVVETEILGFHIVAGTPVVGPFSATVTTLSQGEHVPAYNINAMLPLPEPTSLVLMALGGLALLRRRS